MLEGLDGKVAIVTGAARGLGRAEALELARQGVRVVVSDLGRNRDGELDTAAEEVVEEIRGLGGLAVAQYGDVGEWDNAASMVELALHEFGQLDILVNSAGFLRDRMPFNMSEEEWDSVVRVHMKGHFLSIRHALGHWRAIAKAEGQVYGRIISTTSEAGFHGAVGQVNYSAAKGGIIQLTLGAGQALAKYGVTANCIAPRADTAMTADKEFMKKVEDDGFKKYAPENVSPLVAYLASPASQGVNGQVFIVFGRQIDVLAAPEVAERFLTDSKWTPDGVNAALTPWFEDRPGETFGFDLKASAAL
jgi:3-oxoacyl-[acyl-carrier protein] reductase